VGAAVVKEANARKESFMMTMMRNKGTVELLGDRTEQKKGFNTRGSGNTLIGTIPVLLPF
jgi:hypothetical protein